MLCVYDYSGGNTYRFLVGKYLTVLAGIAGSVKKGVTLHRRESKRKKQMSPNMVCIT